MIKLGCNNDSSDNDNDGENVNRKMNFTTTKKWFWWCTIQKYIIFILTIQSMFIHILLDIQYMLHTYRLYRVGVVCTSDM